MHMCVCVCVLAFLWEHDGMLGMQTLFLILVRMESAPCSKPSPKLHYLLLYLVHILIAFRDVPKNVNVII